MGSFKQLALAAAIASIVALTGCGGGGSGSSNSDSSNGGDTGDNAGDNGTGDNDNGDNTTTTATGVFVDSPVVGINYATATHAGKTNDLGEYEYEPGETVTFSIGGIGLPPVEATGRVTPADMGNGTADWSADPTVVNILRLLQTLDTDGDASNGITITDQVHNALKDVALDPKVSEADFETQANTAIVSTGKTLIDKAKAVDHFKESQSTDLVGSWVYVEEGGNVNVLSFLNDREYLIAHSTADGNEQRAGSGEYGTYLWNSATGELSLGLLAESDGSGGLVDNEINADWTMQMVDGALVLTSAADNEDVVFSPIRNDSDSLVGSWYLGGGEVGDNALRHNVLTILDDSRYVIAHNDNQEAYDGDLVEAVASEWGTYSFDGATFAVTNVSAELDGPGGLYDNPAENDGNGFVAGPATLHPTGELTLTGNEEGEEFTLQRMGRYAVALRDFEGDTRQLYVRSLQYPGSLHDRESTGFVFPDLVAQGAEGIFDLAFSDNDQITFILNTENDGARTGTVHFDSSGEENAVGDWGFSSSGALVVTESGDSEGDYGQWRFVILNEDGKVLVHLDGPDPLELMFITQMSTAAPPQ